MPTTKMKHPKSYYQTLKLPAGWTWGYWDSAKKLHSFVCKTAKGYAEVRCFETEIADGSLGMLIEGGFTR